MKVDMKVDMMVDMKVDMVADVKVDMVTEMKVDMVADMKVDMVVDMKVDMDFHFQFLYPMKPNFKPFCMYHRRGRKLMKILGRGNGVVFCETPL